MVAEASAPQSAPEVLMLMHDNYLDVLGMFGQGEPLKPMKGPPMKITLQNDKPMQPKCILMTRQIPIHMQEEANNIIKQAIQDGILQKTNEPTDWISPAFFIWDPAHGKKKGKLCLVSDFSEPNKYLKRPVHPFPSSKDIINKIRHDSKVFVKLDGLKGYFQILLNEESSFLITILLPNGNYCYKQAPMGLSSSTDEWNICSDTAVAGLDGIAKEVDDILIQAPDYPTLRRRLKETLEKCWEHGITISKQKIEMGETINLLVTSQKLVSHLMRRSRPLRIFLHQQVLQVCHHC